jgi:CDP-diacylglycerol---serine O-phosphatidyltransferase
MRHIPNFITSLNLLCGFIAIIFTAHGDVVIASWFILAAMIFDFLDGLSARLLHAYSDIGKELDSLADVVSFGVAPGLILYHLLSNSSSSLNHVIVMIIPAVMPVCGAIRLAIFNIDTTQSTSFKGLPIPGNALTVISFIIAGHYSGSPFVGSLLNTPVAIILLALIPSFLMVTRMPLISLKVKHLRFKENEGRYILVALVIVVLILFGLAAMPLIIPLYLISSGIDGLFSTAKSLNS